MLNHQEPYLILGPFKCEIKQDIPEMMVVHDFAEEYEMNEIIKHANGNLVATQDLKNTGMCSLHI